MVTLSNYKIQNYVWLALMVMTLGSAFIAESAEPSLLVTLAIAGTVGLKGWLVVDRFMELRNAHPYIRFSMNLYFIMLPLVILIVYLIPESIADLTRL
ncbi:cytochrome C oxidase subunit IV family protein [Motiliproteus sp. MSK22-1]|uniref:cytochrome C oxidase subunit IV family protein n=1 Tax=Motiliproteus sp. MSK22-1 TaxID=1897630 RepID=UPI0009771968|nr:cytochrome C oxidase subunit IV family protein [Motiliproteus sp. MSK22-1]OMH38029.1 hypothetical protein BGP75_07025 [Motiliproteus sp. MSK22-1]